MNYHFFRSNPNPYSALASDGDFDESKHKRGPGGKFGSGSGGNKQPTKGSERSMSERHEMAAKAHEAEAARGGPHAAVHLEGAKKHRAAAEAHSKGEADAHHKSGVALEHYPGVTFPGKENK